MSRKQALTIHTLMFAALLTIMAWCRVDAKNDIAAVRVENKASIQLILSTLTENDKAARERGKGIGKSVDTLIGITDSLSRRVDALTRGLIEPTPKGNHK